jgi:hypothetical protein
MNRLRGQALDTLEEHLLVCEKCRRRLTDTETFLGDLRAEASAGPGPPLRVS